MRAVCLSVPCVCVCPCGQFGSSCVMSTVIFPFLMLGRGKENVKAGGAIGGRGLVPGLHTEEGSLAVVHGSPGGKIYVLRKNFHYLSSLSLSLSLSARSPDREKEKHGRTSRSRSRSGSPRKRLK